MPAHGGRRLRQYRHVLNDREITDRFRVIAFDLPYHGRSTPADGWWLKKYRLTTHELSRDDPRGVARARTRAAGGDGLLDGRRDRAEGRGRIPGRAVAASSGWKARPMRRAATTSSCIIRRSTAASLRRATPTGSMRRSARRKAGARTGGTTASRGPGVYQGDVHFYSNDWDGREDIKRIDTNRCKVALLTGEYDYSCTPEMTREGRGEHSGLAAHHHEGHGAFPDDRELSGISGRICWRRCGTWRDLCPSPREVGRGWGVKRDGEGAIAEQLRAGPSPQPSPRKRGERERTERALFASFFFSSPARRWISGKNMSCHFAGRCLIEPTSAMKFA